MKIFSHPKVIFPNLFICPDYLQCFGSSKMECTHRYPHPDNPTNYCATLMLPPQPPHCTWERGSETFSSVIKQCRLVTEDDLEFMEKNQIDWRNELESRDD